MQPLTLLPAKLSGTEFLQATHLSIANHDHDPSLFCSTTKQDYVSHPDCIRDPAVPTKHSNVINKDLQYYSKRCTEMKDVFEYTPTQRTLPCGANLSRTSYKEHADPNRFMEYDTMSKLQFHVMPATCKQEQSRGKWGDDIPQGDPEKQKECGSEYKNSFLNSLDKVANDPVNREYKPTLMGDNRQNNYISAHRDQFKPAEYCKLQPIIPTYKSNIPFGDASKCFEKQSIFHEAFKYNPGVKRIEEKKSIQTSHINQSDGINKAGDTEFQSCYVYRGDMGMPIRVSMNATRNHSDIAEGDIDVYRNRERANATTSRYHFSRFRPAEPNPELPQNVHTRSDVVIGNDKLIRDYYVTSMKDDFVPVNNKGREPVKLAPYFNPIADGDKDTCLNATVYQKSYTPSIKTKPQINPIALEKLRGCSILKELKTDETETTNVADYVAHANVKPPQKLDTYRMQRSHFGDLNL